MKKTLVLLFLMSSVIFSQKKKSTKIGQMNLDEIKMTIYEKDSTAAAVVLYEQANVYLDRDNEYKTRTDYYYRIKILNKNAFDLANVEVMLYKKQKAIDIKGITYNLNDNGTVNKQYLQDVNIFENKESENYTSKKFTLPNIKEGSVIEYTYSLISPYSGLEDWDFQTDIPKIKSDYNAAILGNYKYNIRLIGNIKLDKNESSIDKNCVYIDGLGPGQCVIYYYSMENIPAFEEEDYMLSKKNFVSRLSFDLESYTDTRGAKTKYTTSWKAADKKLNSIFFNNQTSKKTFFKNKLPDSILNNPNTLERAKKVYNFIQNHFTWNKRYWSQKDEKVKQAFNNKSGTSGEINLALYNSLNAANIETDLVILSTRDHGLPTKLYPIIFDFNYVIVRIAINNKFYYLDATSRFLPFGQIPTRCLNGEARIINYKSEDNWVVLKPIQKSRNRSTIKLVLNEEGELTGSLIVNKFGYFAEKQREKIYNVSENDYLQNFEEDHPDFEVEDYSVANEYNLEKPLIENYKVSISMDTELGNKARINPFLFNRFSKNPFKLKDRNYPVDFAYPRKNAYALSLQIPENYKVSQLPKNVAIGLPNKGGSFILKTIHKDNIINIYVRLNTTRKIYSSSEYLALKEFFNRVVSAENSYIVLEKI